MSPLPTFLTSPPPSVGVEIASDRVTAVSVARHGGAATLAAHATERLAPGVVTPALNAVNIHDREAVAKALRGAFMTLGTSPRRVALVIPDTAAKVSLLRFEKVPAANDLDQLIRWQVRKAAPFKPEDGLVSWMPASELAGGGREFLVTMARHDIIDSYQQVCADAGAHAGIVDLATLNLVNAALASGVDGTGDDWLVVHVAAGYATIVIIRGSQLIYFRTRQLEADGDLADLVHQTSMYHEDRLGGSRFVRVLLSGASARGPEAGERARRGLEERLGVRIEALDFRGSATMRDRISAGPELLDTLAPAVGVILRERTA